MYSNSCCTERLAQGCVIGLKGVTVNSVEALITALIPQLVSDVEVNTFSFQICRRFQNAAKNGRVRLTKSTAPMSKKDKFDLTGHLVRFIWYVFLGAATIQVIEHIKAFMVETPTHQLIATTSRRMCSSCRERSTLRFQAFCVDRRWRSCFYLQRIHTYTRPREAEPICGMQDDVRIGPVPNVVVTHIRGLYSIEVQVSCHQSWTSPTCLTKTRYG